MMDAEGNTALMIHKSLRDNTKEQLINNVILTAYHCYTTAILRSLLQLNDNILIAQYY